MDQTERHPVDAALLDLFRHELATHGAILEDGLSSLEVSGASDRIPPLLNAARAIKGGARIVDIEVISRMAAALERGLLMVQKGEKALSPRMVESLVKAATLLHELAGTGLEAWEEWLQGHQEDMEKVVLDIQKVDLPEPEKRPAPPRQESPPTPVPEQPAQSSGPLPSAPDMDPAMMDLFRSETQAQVALLNDGLLSLQKDPTALKQTASLADAARAIQACARIVDLEGAANVARAMEQALRAYSKGTEPLSLQKISALLKGVELLNGIVEALAGDVNVWMANHAPELNGFAASLSRAQASGEGAPAQTRADSPPLPPPPPKVGPAPGFGPETQSIKPSPSSPRTSLPGTGPGIQKTPSRGKEAEFRNDPAMLDLFQAEVENYVAVLNEGLLALENDPGATDRLEVLMRAAHSIKGGARIVGLDEAVKAAHAMEDCFVAAQKGQVRLGSDQIDILLRIVDIFIQLSQSLREGGTDWLARHGQEIDQLVQAITAILHGEEAIRVYPVEETPVQTPDEDEVFQPPATEPAAQARPCEEEPHRRQAGPPFVPSLHPAGGEAAGPVMAQPHTDMAPVVQERSEVTTERDRTVRVTASKIERLMAQAGEVVVSARWLPTFSVGLLELKKKHVELLQRLDGLQEILLGREDLAEASDLLLQVRAHAKACNLGLAEKLNQFDMFNSSTAALSDRLYHEVISVRMRPFADGIQSFPRMVRDLARDLGKRVTLDIRGKKTEVDRDILEKLDAPLNHLLRNAVDHGIESPELRKAAGKPEAGTIRLEAAHRSGMLMITVADDGGGIDLVRLKGKIVERGLASEELVEQMSEPELLDFLFLPGFSTAKGVTEISGRGVGLDVVRNMVHEVGGVVRAYSTYGKGLSFHMELPLTLSVMRTFLVEIEGEPFAFPLARIDRCLHVSRAELETVEDRQYFRFDNNNIALVDIHNILEMEPSGEYRDPLSVVVVSDRLNAYGLAVDRFLGECDLVVRPMDPRLGKVPDIGAVAVMMDGSPVLIFDVEDLVRSIDNLLSGRRLRKLSKKALEKETRQKKRVLVVDDSFTVREMERKLLESQGYQVETAVDGVDGWNAVRTGQYHMVISDVDMPRMNGIELVSNIKQHPVLKSLPVIIISYKDKEEDRLKGLEAGANYYLTKGSFEDDSLIQAAHDLIGEA